MENLRQSPDFFYNQPIFHKGGVMLNIAQEIHDVGEQVKVAVLKLDGKLVIGDEVTFFRETIKEALRSGYKNFVLDMAYLRYVDSVGFGALVSMFTRVRGVGGVWKICCLQDRVKRRSEVNKLLYVFDVYKDLDEALKSFEGE
jgi:anti-sigma B factor antagonist